MSDIRSVTGAPIEPEDKKQSRRRFLEMAGGTAVLGGIYGVSWFNKESFAIPKGIRPPTKASASTWSAAFRMGLIDWAIPNLPRL